MVIIKNIKTYLLIIAGSLSLALGTIGIVVPVLPTTPFLLLSAYLYLRSSKKLYNWLIRNKVLGKYIYSYMKYKSIPISTKIQSEIVLWLGLIISMIVVDRLWIRLLLVAVGIGVSIHILMLKTINKAELISIEEDINNIQIT